MVTIQNVTFYYQRSFFKLHTGTLILIRQSICRSDNLVKFYLINQKQSNEYFLLNDDEPGLLEILLDCTNDVVLKVPLKISLNISEELEELTHLLFTYYLSNFVTYRVDHVVEHLVRQIFKLNVELVNVGENFMKLLKMMEDNINQALQMEDFCQNLYFSESQLNHFCKLQTGMTVSRLFRKMKCLEANRLLQETSLTIKEISEHLGFKSSKHFSTMYRQIEGVPPIKKRRLLKSNEYVQKRPIWVLSNQAN